MKDIKPQIHEELKTGYIQFLKTFIYSISKLLETNLKRTHWKYPKEKTYILKQEIS